MSEALSTLERVLDVHDARREQLPRGLGDQAEACQRLCAVLAPGEFHLPADADERVRVEDIRRRVGEVCREDELNEHEKALLMMIIGHGRARMERLAGGIPQINPMNDPELDPFHPLQFLQKEILRLSPQRNLDPTRDKREHHDALHTLFLIIAWYLEPKWDLEGVRQVLERDPAFRDAPEFLEELKEPRPSVWKIRKTRDGVSSAACAKRKKGPELFCEDGVTIEMTEDQKGRKYYIQLVFDGASARGVDGLPDDFSVDHDNLLKWIFNQMLGYNIASELKTTLHRTSEFPSEKDIHAALKRGILSAKNRMILFLPELLRFLDFTPRVERRKRSDMESIKIQLQTILRLYPHAVTDLARFYAFQCGPVSTMEMAVACPALELVYQTSKGDGGSFLFSPDGKMVTLSSRENVLLDPVNGDQRFIDLFAQEDIPPGKKHSFPPGSTVLSSTDGLISPDNLAQLATRISHSDPTTVLAHMCTTSRDAPDFVEGLTEEFPATPLPRDEDDFGFAVTQNPMGIRGWLKNLFKIR